MRWINGVFCFILLESIIAYHFGYSWFCAAACLFTAILLILSIIDLDIHILPDSLTLSLLWLGLLINTQALFIPLDDAVLGAAGGYLILRGMATLFFYVTKKTGMGGGDFKLLAAIGAWVGWMPLPQIIAAASLSGIIVFGIMALKKQKQHVNLLNKSIAFGPFLAFWGWLAILVPKHFFTNKIPNIIFH